MPTSSSNQVQNANQVHDTNERHNKPRPRLRPHLSRMILHPPEMILPFTPHRASDHVKLRWCWQDLQRHRVKFAGAGARGSGHPKYTSRVGNSDRAPNCTCRARGYCAPAGACLQVARALTWQNLRRGACLARLLEMLLF